MIDFICGVPFFVSALWWTFLPWWKWPTDIPVP